MALNIKKHTHFLPNRHTTLSLSKFLISIKMAQKIPNVFALFISKGEMFDYRQIEGKHLSYDWKCYTIC